MEHTSPSFESQRSSIERIIAAAKAVITDPAGFFRTMPRTGGYVEPATFIVATSIATSIVGSLLWLVGSFESSAHAMSFLVWAFVISPIVSVVGAFVWGGIFFAIWRALGSEEPYETAFRCGAYMTAITPIVVVLNYFSVIGTLIALGWGFGLSVIASSEVHGIPRPKARIAFGILFAVFALLSISSQRAAERAHEQTEALNEKFEKLDEMTPEEAGKAVGEFMKGLQGTVEEKQEAPAE